MENRKLLFQEKVKIRVKYLLTRSNKQYSTEKRKIFVALAADYANLGDLAITHAEIRFLKKMFPECEVIECPISDTLACIKTIKKNIGLDDIIALIGGGNLSDKYRIIELYRQFWIKSFPQNMIFSFPQSCDLKNADKPFLDNLKKVYRMHKNLFIFARDNISYKVLSDLVPEKVYLAPDIVLSLGSLEDVQKREGVLFCIRNDKEKSKNADKIRTIHEYCEGKFPILWQDTYFNYNGKIDQDKRKKCLTDIWKLFSGKELVITDRLHGMIFAYITNTPCLALDNNNHKISAFFKSWLQNKESRIVFIAEGEEVEIEMIKQLMKKQIANTPFDFTDFANLLRKFANI